MQATVLTALILGAAAVVGTAIGVVPAMTSSPASAAPNAISGCIAVDGDTLRCQGERIRLLAIDAPELPGHCQVGRLCAPGDPIASTAALGQLLEPMLTIERVGQDRYGRTLAIVAGSKGDFSCSQLRARRAIYKAAWDNGGRVARICPDAARPK